MTQKPLKQSVLQFISQYWFLIFFIGGMLVTWGVFQQRIDSQDARIVILETQTANNNQVLTTLQVNIGEIKTSLEFIKQRLQ